MANRGLACWAAGEVFVRQVNADAGARCEFDHPVWARAEDLVHRRWPAVGVVEIVLHDREQQREIGQRGAKRCLQVEPEAVWSGYLG